MSRLISTALEGTSGDVEVLGDFRRRPTDVSIIEIRAGKGTRGNHRGEVPTEREQPVSVQRGRTLCTGMVFAEIEDML